MYRYIAKGKFDTVICTHVFSAVMLTQMQKSFPLALKTAMIMTDYTCYPGMEATDLQMYFIPDGSFYPGWLLDRGVCSVRDPQEENFGCQDPGMSRIL